jgi:predicted amidohydrolase YtcJ
VIEVPGSPASEPPETLARQFRPDTVIDVGGRTVLPGLIDAHNHFLATGESRAAADVRYLGTDSLEALLDVVPRPRRNAWGEGHRVRVTTRSSSHPHAGTWAR